MQKAKRAKITIAGIELEVFMLPDGNYVMSQTQVAQAIGQHHPSVGRFLASEKLQPILGKDYTPNILSFDNSGEIRGGSGTFKAIPLQVAGIYWTTQAISGNDTAQALVNACMIESLERRADAVFKQPRTEAEYEARSYENFEKWRHSRDFSKLCHNAFQSACYRHGFDAALAHDELTKAITGKTAYGHRKLPLVGTDKSIGLDHVPKESDIRRIGEAKLNFARYRSGTLWERIRRAVQDTLKACP